MKKFNEKETKEIKNLTIPSKELEEIEEFEEEIEKLRKEKNSEIKLEEKITKEELQESLKKFKENKEPNSEDMYPIFRNILTYNSWLIPTSSKNENNEEMFKVDAIIEENGKKSIRIFSDSNLWKKEKENSNLIEIEHLSIICNNVEIEEIIIDYNTDHMFIIPKEFFEILIQWETIVHTEVKKYQFF